MRSWSKKLADKKRGTVRGRNGALTVSQLPKDRTKESLYSKFFGNIRMFLKFDQRLLQQGYRFLGFAEAILALSQTDQSPDPVLKVVGLPAGVNHF